MQEFDIVIVGGGLAGLALLNAIDKTQQRVLLIDNSNQSNQPSSRPLVLTAANAAWLNYKDGNALTEVKVSVQDKFGILKLKAEAYGLSEFGYVVDAVKLQQALLAANSDWVMPGTVVNDVIERTDVVELILSDTTKITTKLLVAADGNNSSISRGFNIPRVTAGDLQVAIIPNITTSRACPAALRFIANGTLAFLPTGVNLGTIVATGAATTVDLQQAWSQHLPIKHNPGLKIAYRQTSSYLASTIRERIVFVGNAAHSLPPVGAQGFNLACSNIISLSHNIAQGLDLERYQQDSMARTKQIFGLCDLLTKQKLTSLPIVSELFLALINSSAVLQSEIVATGMQTN